MPSPTVRPSALIVGLTLFLTALMSAAATRAATAPPPDPLASLRFVENRGQLAEEIAFYTPSATASSQSPATTTCAMCSRTATSG